MKGSVWAFLFGELALADLAHPSDGSWVYQSMKAGVWDNASGASFGVG